MQLSTVNLNTHLSNVSLDRSSAQKFDASVKTQMYKEQGIENRYD
jgi:hypothetical protein